MYAAFSSSFKKNQAEQSNDESNIARSKPKINLEGILISSSSARNRPYSSITFLNHHKIFYFYQRCNTLIIEHVNDIVFILTDELLDKEILPTDIKVNNGTHSDFFPLPANKKMKMSNISSSSSSPKKYLFSRTDDTSPGQASGSTSAESGPIRLTKSQRIKKAPSWLEDYMENYEE